MSRLSRRRAMAEKWESKVLAEGHRAGLRGRYRLSGSGVQQGYSSLTYFSPSPSCMARVIDYEMKMGYCWDTRSRFVERRRMPYEDTDFGSAPRAITEGT